MICYFCRKAADCGFRIKVDLPNVTNLYSVIICDDCAAKQRETMGYVTAPMPHYYDVLRTPKADKVLRLAVEIEPYQSPLSYYEKAIS